MFSFCSKQEDVQSVIDQLELRKQLFNVVKSSTEPYEQKTDQVKELLEQLMTLEQDYQEKLNNLTVEIILFSEKSCSNCGNVILEPSLLDEKY